MLYYDLEDSSHFFYMPEQEPGFSPQTPWHKTSGGLVFVGTIGTIITICLIFFLYTVYFIWQVKYGDAEKAARSVNPNFSSLATSTDAMPISPAVMPVEQFIQTTNPVQGQPEAPLTIVVFIDFECPFCQASHPIFTNVVKQFGPAVKVVFKHFPITALHPNAIQVANAAECAGAQGKFWEFYTQVFDRKLTTEQAISEYATNLNLNLTTFAACRNAEPFQNRIEQDIKDGLTLQVRGTPTYFVNNTKIEGVISETDWSIILIEELKKMTQQ